jgi:hypothetical protein
MTQEALKKMYQLLLTEPHAPTVCAQLERIAREALADHAMRETQRLGQEIEQEPVIGKWVLREVYFDEDGEPTMHRSPPQPERHELQAKGEHPAPCARHCEANAFQIVIKNLKAQLAQRKPLTLDQICKALLSICDDGSAPTSTDDPEFVELIVPLARAIEVAHGIKENT